MSAESKQHTELSQLRRVSFIWNRRMPRYILRKLACTVWGCSAALVATLWCLCGAGIYGSPLPLMGKEGWFIVAYLVCGAGSTFAAGWIVWVRPLWASRFLFVGGLLSSLIAGRYLWVNPAFIVLAFGLPGIMILLAWTTSGIEKQGSSDKLAERRRSKYPTFTLAELLLLCTAIALTLAHGRVARVPSYRPTLLMQEFCGGFSPDSMEVLEQLQREERDAVQVLQQEYGIRFEFTRGGSGMGGQYKELDVFRSWHRSAGRPRSALVVDLEKAMRSLVHDRSLTIRDQSQSPGSLLMGRGLPDGFWIRYRDRHVEGLIQAGARPGQERAIMCIEERTRRNCLSLGEPYYVPQLQGW